MYEAKLGMAGKLDQGAGRGLLKRRGVAQLGQALQQDGADRRVDRADTRIGHKTLRDQRGVAVQAEAGGEQFVEMAATEWVAGTGLQLLLRGESEGLEGHGNRPRQPPSRSGQVHTFKSPGDEAWAIFSKIQKDGVLSLNACFGSCASRVGTCRGF
ncbi:hypothetical protein D3C78_1010390 [compost metagenome]